MTTVGNWGIAVDCRRSTVVGRIGRELFTILHCTADYLIHLVVDDKKLRLTSCRGYTRSTSSFRAWGADLRSIILVPQVELQLGTAVPSAFAE